MNIVSASDEVFDPVFRNRAACVRDEADLHRENEAPAASGFLPMAAAVAARIRWSAQISGVQPAMIADDSAPIAANSSASIELTFPMMLASAAGSSHEKWNPLPPLWTKSAAQPHRDDTSTGSPLAIASLTTSPHGSFTLGRMKHPANA